MSEIKKINTLVLDAGPLITQSASHLQQYATNFVTTPGVYSELKDENVKRQLLIWNNTLTVRHPKREFIKKVSDFAKLTGDFQVLSANDIHVIALAYELECELNGGDWRLRQYPGEVKNAKKAGESVEEIKTEQEVPEEDTEWTTIPGKQQPQPEIKKKQRRRGGKKQRAKREAEAATQEGSVEETEVIEAETVEVQEETVEPEETTQEPKPSLDEEYDESDDDGEWITPENLIESIQKDANTVDNESSANIPKIKVALATGDFACQNVSMQIGLNLMNYLSGLQIKRVRNYMYRCHGCFRMTPFSKDGKPRHFCPHCGGATLLRCAISVDSRTGEIIPHLKKNFQWIKRGEKYSIPSPLSKNQQKLQGNAGYQHNKVNQKQETILLREDQKEYQKALKDDAWQRRQNEKILDQWIGGGSADNYISPFVNNVRPGSGVKVGKGRFVNSSKATRK